MTILPDLRHYTRADAAAIREVLFDIHDEVYADTGDPLADRAEFAPFADHWLGRQGFACVIGYDGHEPVGYAYGAPLDVISTWWDKVEPAPPVEFRQETGTRTFALSELMVREPWRGTGVARRVHDALLGARGEERVTLFTHKAHPRVRAMYGRWGYETVGEVIPFEGAPELVAMVLRLR